ncbi:poly-gamma-glutamate hydrolase family protein [Halopiger djelfimassiliensis]|uniref:poly-gamma-glutamate hydrolase family protein n=1 Tax=Halopiger djelfimassiliensis TaxID=1293047 RepID=UPI000677C833|nr:poly-gamma-glutamate hydrolase family protein [Halopiger djelfimassiliensis]
MARPTLTTRHLERTETGRYTELLYDDGANDAVAVCAAHGGRVEPGTAEQALELATRLPEATCWACLGYAETGSAFDLWHPPSSAISPAEYPLLEHIADRGFETVISLHGLADDRVIVGGGVDDGVKRRVGQRLETAVSHPVETASDGPYGGVSPDNFVNWLAREGRGGLQLEQSPAVRDSESDAVVSTLAGLVEDGRL